MRIRDRTHYISDEEGKMWKVREFFYLVEVKDLIVIYIIVNMSIINRSAKSPFCEKEIS